MYYIKYLYRMQTNSKIMEKISKKNRKRIGVLIACVDARRELKLTGTTREICHSTQSF